MNLTYQDLAQKYLRGSTPILCEISHPYLKENICLTDNNRKIEYEGKTYLPSTIKAKLPDSSEDSTGNATITISVIDQQLIELVRNIDTPPTFKVIACYYEDGIISRLDGYQFIMTNLSCDAISMTADLTNDLMLEYAFPNGESTTITTPGIT